VSSVFEIIAEGIAKSRNQLALAEAEEWELFLELDEERQQLLRRIKLNQVRLSEVELLRLQKEMAILVELNSQLEQLCLQQRSILAGRLKKIRVGSRVSKAYTQ